jgi:hypothetical protein
MATLVKVKGLERDNAAATGSIGPARGFRVASGYGLQFPSGVKATATVASTPTFTFTAKYGGTWANGHAVTVATGGTAGAIAVAYAAGTGVPTFTISTGGTLTVTQAVAALNADSRFSQLYTAAGTGAALTAGGTGTLAGGTNVGTGQVIYVVLSSKGLMIVDVDDAQTQRTLRRGTNRYISLGAA